MFSGRGRRTEGKTRESGLCFILGVCSMLSTWDVKCHFPHLSFLSHGVKYYRVPALLVLLVWW